MITIRNIHKSFGTQTLFEDASLQINDGERFALVGPNGSGKSTLFKLLLGETEPDSGHIQVRKGAVPGYLPQENAPVSDKTVLEETVSELDASDGKLVAEAKSVLMGLGFKTTDFTRMVSTLSGGWAMRTALAKLLMKKPDLLLLDEPTNHLDLDSLLWLQEYLYSYSGAVFIVSHDRSFINIVCRAVVDVQGNKLKVYHGDYEYYLARREAEKEKLVSEWKQQQNEIEQMKEFISRNRARLSSASRAQNMMKRLEKLEIIELPPESKTVKIRFPQPSRTGVRTLNLKNLNKSYALPGQPPIRVYENLNFELERGWKMAFVGHNGAGKSTLLKLLAGVIEPDSGERIPGINVKTGYFSQHRAGMLNPEKTVLQEALDNRRMNPELMVRTVLGTFLFPGDSVFKKTKVLSGGEKSRLALVKLLLDPPNALLMDEPTTHLDMPSVEALVSALKEFEGTLCFISHDLYFINSLATHIVHIDGGKITVYPGNYEYFERRSGQMRMESEEHRSDSGKTPQMPASEWQSRAESPGGKSAEPYQDRKEKRRQKALEIEKNRELQKQAEEIVFHKKQLALLAEKLSDPEIHKNYEQVKAIGGEIRRLEELIKKTGINGGN